MLLKEFATTEISRKELFDKYNITPGVFYHWKRKLENGGKIEDKFRESVKNLDTTNDLDTSDIIDSSNVIDDIRNKYGNNNQFKSINEIHKPKYVTQPTAQRRRAGTYNGPDYG